MAGSENKVATVDLTLGGNAGVRVDGTVDDEAELKAASDSEQVPPQSIQVDPVQE